MASASDMATVSLARQNAETAQKLRQNYDEIIKRKQRDRAMEAAGYGQGGANTGGQMASYGYTGYTGPSGAQEPTSKQRQQLVQSAQSFSGSPYKLGGTTAQGIDCSGLIKAVYTKYGYGNIQHSASWQGRNIPGVRTSFSNLKPGDLVAWKDGSHIAIYAGNGYIIDASSRRGTTTRPLWTSTDNVYGISVRLPGE
jgi:cell wall-associated NlpC family hydrolase